MAKQQKVFLVTNGSGYLSGYADSGLPIWGRNEFKFFPDEEDARRHADDSNGTVVWATLTLTNGDAP